MDAFVNIISSVGFPIACAVALGWYAKDTTSKIISLTEKCCEALVSSTTATNEMKEVLKDIVEELKGRD